MPGTIQNIKDFFALEGHNVTNNQLTKFQEVLQRDGYSEDASGAINWLYDVAKRETKRVGDAAAKAAAEASGDYLWN